MTDRRQPICIDCDTLVVGGGAAGVAAAVTASRNGLKTVLLERYGFCGGGAVAGMSGTVCGTMGRRNGTTPIQIKSCTVSLTTLSESWSKRAG